MHLNEIIIHLIDKIHNICNLSRNKYFSLCSIFDEIHNSILLAMKVRFFQCNGLTFAPLKVKYG